MTLHRKHIIVLLVSAGSLAAPLGCEDLPGGPEEQGAVAGGVGGAVLGAVLAGDNPLIGGLIGGALGALGGWLIGANWDKITGDDREEAQKAVQKAQNDPATPEEARNATTADINSDGFVTLDEVVAMKRAGFSDDDMIQRLGATDQIFELTPPQEQFLVDNGVSRRVVEAMRNINQDKRLQLLEQKGYTTSGEEVISRPRR